MYIFIISFLMYSSQVSQLLMSSTCHANQTMSFFKNLIFVQLLRSLPESRAFFKKFYHVPAMVLIQFPLSPVL